MMSLCHLDVGVGSHAIYKKGFHFLHLSNMQNFGSHTSYRTWSYKLASVYLAFDCLQSIRSSLLCSGFSKVFIDILMLELGHALEQNKGRDLDFR